MQKRLIVIFLISSFCLAGCKAPPVPPEVKESEIQEHDLWRAEAHFYAPEEYEKYKASYRDTRKLFFREKAKFSWFRKYKSSASAFQSLIAEGERILEKIQKQKEIKSAALLDQSIALKNKIMTIQKISLLMDEGRFIRHQLIQSELKLGEVELLYQKGNFFQAEKKLIDTTLCMQKTEDLLLSLLERYRDEALLKKWEGWVNDTLLESKHKGIFVIVVSKIDQKLFLYKNGEIFGTYEIGLGRNGLFDKNHAGDYATPEGRYHIIKKLSPSQYYKALLIDYPNKEDKSRYSIGRRDGVIPPGVGPGGLIELHGGGNGAETDGCISLDNNDIDKIFNLVDVGTPVTIIGAFDNIKKILSLE